MKLRIGTTSNPEMIVRETASEPAPPDPRPFAVRNRELLDRVAKHRRKRLIVIDGGKPPEKRLP